MIQTQKIIRLLVAMTLALYANISAADVEKNGKLMMSNRVFGDPSPRCPKGFEANAVCNKQ